jgi:outer membrane protein insertion porin family
LDASIRPLYDARGRIRVSFPSLTVTPAKMIDGVVVTVAVNEGPSYSLSAVKFAGIPRADADEAQRVANLQANDVANFDEVKAGLDRVLLRYRNRGYLKATSHLDREIDDQEHTVSVLATLEPGPQFTMGKLEIVGLDITSEPAIRKVWGIKPGAPFQPDYPDAFLNDLRAQGVFDNLGKTRSVAEVDEKSHSVDVTLYFAGAGPPDRKRGKKGPLVF